MKWAIGLALLGASAWAGSLPVPKIDTLPNGLRVAWFPNPKLPLIDMAVLIRSGQRADAHGKSGTAELLSSVLDRGNGGKSAQDLARTLDALGAKSYVSADDDTFTVGVHGLSIDSKELLRVLGLLVRKPDFPKKEVQRERKRLLFRWEHLGDYAQALVSLGFHRNLTSGTSYGRGGFRGVQEFKKIDRQDLVTFHRKHFVPSNAMLMIVGQVKQKDFFPEVAKVFGVWKGGKVSTRFRSYTNPSVQINAGQKALFVDRKDLTQAQIKMGFRAPGLKDPMHYELVVANALLGEYYNSRLNRALRDKMALTYGISSSFSYSKSLAYFSISTATSNRWVGRVVTEARKILAGLSSLPATAKEVRQAKEYLVGSFPVGTATVNAVATRWLAGQIYGLGPTYLNEFIPRVKAVTLKGVNGAIRKHLNVGPLRIVIAGDYRKVKPSLKKYQLLPVKLLSAKDLGRTGGR